MLFLDGSWLAVLSFSWLVVLPLIVWCIHIPHNIELFKVFKIYFVTSPFGCFLLPLRTRGGGHACNLNY